MHSDTNHNTPLSTPQDYQTCKVSRCCNPWTSWAAVLAGVTTAIAVQIGLTHLSIASGLALLDPTDPETATGAITFGTAVALLLSTVISVFAGSWVAGRMKFHQTSIEAGIHGMLVWAVSSIATILLTTLAIGVIAGGGFSLLGQGITGAAKGMGAALPSAVEAVVPLWDEIEEDVARAIDQREAGSSEPLLDTRFGDRSRMMQLLGQSFSTDGTSLSKADQDELIQLVSNQVGISPEAARSTYEQWQSTWSEAVSRYEAAKEEAVEMARVAAEAAATRTAQAALVAFIATLLALAAAIAGALLGSRCAKKCIESRYAAGPGYRVA